MASVWWQVSSAQRLAACVGAVCAAQPQLVAVVRVKHRLRAAGEGGLYGGFRVSGVAHAVRQIVRRSNAALRLLGGRAPQQRSPKAVGRLCASATQP